jgi:hypothetical protein
LPFLGGVERGKNSYLQTEIWFMSLVPTSTEPTNTRHRTNMIIKNREWRGEGRLERGKFAPGGDGNR